MNDNLGQEEYMRQKKENTSHAQLTQEQRLNQELRNLPQGKDLFNWIAHHIGKRLETKMMWQYADENEAQQQQSNRINLINGQTNEVVRTIEVNRQEIARVRSMGQSWIEQLMFAIQGNEEQQHQSQMHQRFEQDMSDRYEEMMEKLTGGNE